MFLVAERHSDCSLPKCTLTYYQTTLLVVLKSITTILAAILRKCNMKINMRMQDVQRRAIGDVDDENEGVSGISTRIMNVESSYEYCAPTVGGTE